MLPGSWNYERMERHIITASGKSTKTHVKKSKSIFWRGRKKKLRFLLGRTGCVRDSGRIKADVKADSTFLSFWAWKTSLYTLSHAGEGETDPEGERELWMGMGGTFMANVVWLHLTRECEKSYRYYNINLITFKDNLKSLNLWCFDFILWLVASIHTQLCIYCKRILIA